jgi:hypothetical protein
MYCKLLGLGDKAFKLHDLQPCNFIEVARYTYDF